MRSPGLAGLVLAAAVPRASSAPPIPRAASFRSTSAPISSWWRSRIPRRSPGCRPMRPIRCCPRWRGGARLPPHPMARRIGGAGRSRSRAGRPTRSFGDAALARQRLAFASSRSISSARSPPRASRSAQSPMLLGQPARGEALLAPPRCRPPATGFGAATAVSTALLVSHGGYAEGSSSLAAALLAEAGLEAPAGPRAGIGGFVALERLLMMRPDLLVMHGPVERAARPGLGLPRPSRGAGALSARAAPRPARCATPCAAGPD